MLVTDASGPDPWRRIGRPPSIHSPVPREWAWRSEDCSKRLPAAKESARLASFQCRSIQRLRVRALPRLAQSTATALLNVLAPGAHARTVSWLTTAPFRILRTTTFSVRTDLPRESR